MTSLKGIKKLTLQQQIVGNPACIISDRSTALSSKELRLLQRRRNKAHFNYDRLAKSKCICGTGKSSHNSLKFLLDNSIKWYRHVS